MTYALRQHLPELPRRMLHLPVDERGYPVPWFVQWFHPDGKPVRDWYLSPDARPDFRVVDSRKRVLAINHSLCWVCGGRLGIHKAFVIGPMCAINRVSSEPPSHRECAEFSAQGCPFLSKPHMVRRENDIPEAKVDPPGLHLERNPGVAMVWITRNFETFPVPTEGDPHAFLIRVGEPEFVFWYCQSRTATRKEVMDSIEDGLPSLMEAATMGGAAAVREMRTALTDLQKSFDLCLEKKRKKSMTGSA